MSSICDDLRMSILKSAMQGELTKRELNDDNSEELRKKIIKERSVYKSNKFVEETEYEPNFPDEWSSLKSGEVFVLLNGEKITKGDELPLFDAKYFRGKQASKTNKGNLVRKNNILILVDGENSGETFLCTESGYMGSTFKNLFIPDCIDRDFALYFLEMNRQTLRDNKRGAAIPHLDKKLFFNFVFPIPSIAEQKRIVNKIDKLMDRVADLEKSVDALASLKKAFPDDIKASLLQAAMQGKLTEQSSEDGDVEDLIKEVRAEKEKLIAEGKVKKQKSLAPITDDDIPFSIPKKWKWIHLGEIGNWGSGATPSKTRPEYYKGGNIRWLLTGDLNNGLITEIAGRITELALEETSVRLNPVGSVLIAMYGATIGKLGILGIEATTNQACCACVPYRGIYNWFLFYFLMQHRSDFINEGAGAAQPNISKEKIVATIMPLPPLAEQRRIVNRLNSLMQNVDVVKDLIASE